MEGRLDVTRATSLHRSLPFPSRTITHDGDQHVEQQLALQKRCHQEHAQKCLLPTVICFILLAFLSFLASFGMLPFLNVDLDRKMVSQIVGSDGKHFVSRSESPRNQLERCLCEGYVSAKGRSRAHPIHPRSSGWRRLDRCRLDRCRLERQDICGCDFGGTQGLTQGQFEKAKFDPTKPPKNLPSGIHLPGQKPVASRADDAAETRDEPTVAGSGDLEAELQVRVEVKRPSAPRSEARGRGQRPDTEIRRTSAPR